MSTRSDPDIPIRETYEEFDLGEVRVAMIADPENGHAWIQSDVAVGVER
jgi:hypothetical protein